MQALLSTFVALLFVLPALGDSTPELIAKLKSPEAKVLRQAAEQLGEMKAVEAIPALIELLKMKEDAVSAAARGALRKIGPEAAKGLLEKLKSATEEDQKLLLLTTLEPMQPNAKDALPVLTEALKDKSSEVRIHAALLLGKLSGDQKLALPALFKAAKDTSNVGESLRGNISSNVAQEAIQSAKKLDPKCLEVLAKEVLPDLITAIKSKDRNTHIAACFAIAELDEYAASAKAELLEARKNPIGFTKYPLDRILEKLGEKPHDLNRILSDEVSIEDRVSIIYNLRDDEGDGKKTLDALPTLQKALKDPAARIRYAALETITSLNEKAKPAISDLLPLLDDEPLFNEAHRTGGHGYKALSIYLARVGPSIVPKLLEIAKDRSRPLLSRLQASMALANLATRSRPAKDDFEQLMKNPDIFVYLDASLAYYFAGGDIKKVLPILEKTLSDKRPRPVMQALEILARIGEPAAPTVLEVQKLLTHPDQEIRLLAAAALSGMGPAATTSIPEIAKLLESQSEGERLRIAELLGSFNSQAKVAVPYLVKQLPSMEDRVYPHPYLGLLQEIGPEAKEAVPALVKLLDLKKVNYYEIAKTLAAIGPESKPAFAKLQEGLLHRYDKIRAISARALGAIGPEAKEVVPQLKRMLKDDEIEVRIWSAFALARITKEYDTYVEEMIKLWNYEEPPRPERYLDLKFHRYDIVVACQSLGKKASKSANDLLVSTFLDDKTLFGIRSQAGQSAALMQEDPVRLIPKIVELLNQNHPSIHTWDDPRMPILKVLGSFGPKAKAAVPAIRPLLDDPSQEISEAAFMALQRIEGK